MSLSQLEMNSPIGKLYLTASQKGLAGVFWEKQNVPMKDTLLLRQAQRELNEYFSRQRKVFDVPFDLDGTEFQKKVWQQLLKIPYGKTISYSELADRIKNPKAVRAVGTANGKNPICVLIPCHRVIAADGSLGGYSGGLDKKSKLLELERT